MAQPYSFVVQQVLKDPIGARRFIGAGATREDVATIVKSVRAHWRNHSSPSDSVAAFTVEVVRVRHGVAYHHDLDFRAIGIEKRITVRTFWKKSETGARGRRQPRRKARAPRKQPLSRTRRLVVLPSRLPIPSL